MSEEEQYTADIRVRVPPWVKRAYEKLAKRRLKKESELAREALLSYLAKEGEQTTGDSPTALDVTRAAEGSSAAGHLAQGPEKKQKAELPSANKPLPKRGARANQK